MIARRFRRRRAAVPNGAGEALSGAVVAAGLEVQH